MVYYRIVLLVSLSIFRRFLVLLIFFAHILAFASLSLCECLGAGNPELLLQMFSLFLPFDLLRHLQDELLEEFGAFVEDPLFSDLALDQCCSDCKSSFLGLYFCHLLDLLRTIAEGHVAVVLDVLGFFCRRLSVLQQIVLFGLLHRG